MSDVVNNTINETMKGELLSTLIELKTKIRNKEISLVDAQRTVQLYNKVIDTQNLDTKLKKELKAYFPFHEKELLALGDSIAVLTIKKLEQVPALSN
jgi:hypothetical protein